MSLSENLPKSAPIQGQGTAVTRRAALLSFAALVGCGFTPVYGPGGTAENLRGRISVAAPADEEGFAFVRRLEERLGEPQASDLLLTADILIDEEALGFLPDGELSRFSVEGRVDWQITDADGTLIATGKEGSFTSYSATSTTVATRFAQRDARRRLMVIIADRITSDLLSRSL
jgi:LPS-assembly lipoprotein